ncbi:unnamed protein product [Rotaria socialis]
MLAVHMHEKEEKKLFCFAFYFRHARFRKSLDPFGIIYGVALICGGLFGYFRTGSVISLVFGVVLGVWSVYNAINPIRQKRISNLAIATVLGAIMLYRFYISGKVFPALIVVGLSVAQAYRNYSMLK